MLHAAIQDHAAYPTPALPARQETPPLLVLKFGGSVLRTPADLPRVAGEIYRQRRRGFAVVAVVSAFYGETDRLLAEAAAVGGGTARTGTADLVSLGEAQTAALLRIACDRVGLSALGCQAEELGLTTAGPETGSHVVSFDPAALVAKLARTGLVVVPGFVGTGVDGGRTLLERGGSDFSAIYLAGELGADVARLYKDADGVFEADPHVEPTARRYDEISWSDALRVARPLIKPQAIEYAATRLLPIEVETIGSAQVTRVGPRTGALRPPVVAAPIRVALAGRDAVAQVVARRLASEPRFEVVATLLVDPAKTRDGGLPSNPTGDRATLLAARPEVVVDTLSCAATRSALCVELLGRGVHVVTGGEHVAGERGVFTCGSIAEAIIADLYDAAETVGAP